jgi:hypothetical protein
VGVILQPMQQKLSRVLIPSQHPIGQAAQELPQHLPLHIQQAMDSQGYLLLPPAIIRGKKGGRG